MMQQLGPEGSNNASGRADGANEEQMTDQPDEENSIELSDLGNKNKQKKNEGRRLNNQQIQSDQVKSNI